MSLDKTATVIQHLVDERNKPGFDLLCKVFEVYPNVSKDWLLEGREPMLTDETEAATTMPEDVTPAADAAPKPVAAPTPATPRITTASEQPQEPAPAPAPAVAPTPVEAAPAPLVAPVAAPVPVAPAPVEAVAAVTPPPAAAPTVPAPVAAPALAPSPAPDTSWQTALYTQQMAHQLAMAEMRNQHLLDQQRMMQQMMDLMQRQLQ